MKNRWVVGVTIILCLVFVGIYGVNQINARASQRALSEENVKLMEDMTRLKKRLQSDQDRIRAVDEALKSYAGLSKDMRELLISKGHEDPEAFVLGVLKDQEGLIASEAVLGGTLFFSRIFILRDNLAYAEFEDGHIAGYMLLSFRYDSMSDRIEVDRVFELLE